MVELLRPRRGPRHHRRLRHLAGDDGAVRPASARYFQFLGRQLRAAYRANTRGTILEKDGTASDELTPLQQKWSDEHWLLQYDLMFGKGYALSRMGLKELAGAAD